MIVVSFIVVLGILIFVHELGHFLVAKWLGVKVEKFSLGFGPKLFGRTIGETEYLISAFPLGGYVKMYGEGGFSEAELVEQTSTETAETAAEPVEPPQPIDEARSFSHKPVWARMAIVLAGPAFNMLFAWLLLITLYLVGMPIMKATIGEVFKDKPAAVAGMQKGDRITAVDGHPVVQWEDFSSRMATVRGEVTLSIVRNDHPLTITLVPQAGESKNLFGETVQKPIIGVSPSYEFATERFGLLDAVRMGNAKAVEVTKLTVLSMVKLFQGVVPLKTVGGPLMIADMADKAAKTGGATFFMLLAVVSINLGILNLLPIPILDGGHLLFYTIEAVIRRPVPQKVREYAQQAGMLLLICLMVLAFYNDIVRYFFSKG
ncbi:RIP metalloprotease RseP [Trichlorobacter ammonificans]|uniref:Zinc metalloprotease n=1 Tax=Trichlorobacter ammonificans TaxID=2916410 RepID=A0ABN8HDH5_9BACT|nr:RIP metalloprotease RseP [Trichlorobacter ammonificans]CAH2030823.1 Membrane-associated zinc metalloprotease [Trichlorobacter ammonificans]